MRNCLETPRKCRFYCDKSAGQWRNPKAALITMAYGKVFCYCYEATLKLGVPMHPLPEKIGSHDAGISL